MIEEKSIQTEFHGGGFIPDTLQSEINKDENYERQHKAFIEQILRGEAQVDSPIVMPVYYTELMTWALHRHIEEANWKIVKTHGYHSSMPLYTDVDTGSGLPENLLEKGVLVLEKDGQFLVVTMNYDPPVHGTLIVTGPNRTESTVEGFADAILKIMKERNFYRGRKLELSDKLSFINIPTKHWEDIALDERIIRDIHDNTIGFLNNRDRLKEYGLSCKRGVLLVGAPGTGKSLASKIVLSQATCTCIVARVGSMEGPGYLYWLYRIAEDLSPSIVLLEDIDLIAQSRMFGRSPVLLSLLSILDGVEERAGIITIATTNDLETIDKAISKRPARFDRIIHFRNPALQQRMDIVSKLCKKIPLDPCTCEQIIKRTENFTPAQIIEIAYSLVIDYVNNNVGEKPGCLTFSIHEVETAISKINRDTKQQGFGFTLPANGNTEHCEASNHTGNERKN